PVSAAGGLAVTGIEVDGAAPSDYARKQRVSVSDVRVVAGSGPERPVPAPESTRWDAAMTLTEYGEVRPGKPPVRNGASGLPDFTYDTGVDNENNWDPTSGTLRVTAARPKAAVVKAVATDAYLKSTNAKLGDEIDV
ncbi:ABC transporter permease, partial [Streptomyces sp. SID7499]|nr:ABC transporter permease [Streptomyces sp. SID7499]